MRREVAPSRPPFAKSAPESNPPLDAGTWSGALDRLGKEQLRLAKALSYARFGGVDQGIVTLAFPPETDFARRQVSGDRALLETWFRDNFSGADQLNLVASTEALAKASPSVAEREAVAREATQRSLREEANQDPSVRFLLAQFGGRITQVLPPTKESQDSFGEVGENAGDD